jgi:hypothetical protein
MKYMIIIMIITTGITGGSYVVPNVMGRKAFFVNVSFYY